MDLYGCTDFRGRLVKRGRGRYASTNQVIAGLGGVALQAVGKRENPQPYTRATRLYT